MKQAFNEEIIKIFRIMYSVVFRRHELKELFKSTLKEYMPCLIVIFGILATITLVSLFFFLIGISNLLKHRYFSFLYEKNILSINTIFTVIYILYLALFTYPYMIEGYVINTKTTSLYYSIVTINFTCCVLEILLNISALSIDAIRIALNRYDSQFIENKARYVSKKSKKRYALDIFKIILYIFKALIHLIVVLVDIFIPILLLDYSSKGIYYTSLGFGFIAIPLLRFLAGS